MAGKKSAQQTMEEWLAKQQQMVADPQLQADIMANAGAMKDSATDSLSRVGEQPLAFDPSARPPGIEPAGAPLGQAERQLMGAAQGAGIPIDVNQMNQYSQAKQGAQGAMQGISDFMGMPEGKLGGAERAIMGEMQQLGIPITAENMMAYVQQRDAIMAQAQQGLGQAKEYGAQGVDKAQQLGQQGMDWAKGLLQ